VTFGLLGWPWPKPDPVTADTQRWLDQEARAEQSARAALLELQVRYGALDAELRWRNRMYGKASATIGALRNLVARMRAELTAQHGVCDTGAIETCALGAGHQPPHHHPDGGQFGGRESWDAATSAYRARRGVDAEQQAADGALAAAMQRHPSGAADPADAAKVGDADPTRWADGTPCCEAASSDGYGCTRNRDHRGQRVAGGGKVHAVWPNDADADLVATAERLGDEVGQRDRQAAIEGAATTILAHTWEGPSVTGKCRCGWPGRHHPRHVAEQLAAVGALGTFAPAKKVTIDDVEALARVLNAGDQRFDDLPAWDALADEGRDTYRRLALHVLRAGYRAVAAQPGPRPTPRTGSFADGGTRKFADGTS